VQSDAEPTATEEAGIARFLSLVSEMLLRSDFLLPLAAGQRQFRQDNYNMASAALLEDLFFDAFGMYLRENHPTIPWERRTGKELWDYGFDGLQMSHKETLTGGISVWWTAGDRIDGKWVPKAEYQTFSAKHPIVLVMSGCGAHAWTSDPAALPVTRRGRAAEARKGKFLGTLGARAITGDRQSSLGHTLVLASYSGVNTLEVEHVWTVPEWRELDFHELWPILGGPALGTRDLWVDRVYTDQSTGLASVADAAVGARLTLEAAPLLPGIYVIPSSDMQDVPMVANNRAHSVDQATVNALLDRARRNGRYIPFPTWFAHFAEAPPPNLYGRQRAQYEELFAARRRGPV
jgi:hypothetical protein